MVTSLYGPLTLSGPSAPGVKHLPVCLRRHHTAEPLGRRRRSARGLDARAFGTSRLVTFLHSPAFSEFFFLFDFSQ